MDVERALLIAPVFVYRSAPSCWLGFASELFILCRSKLGIFTDFLTDYAVVLGSCLELLISSSLGSSIRMAGASLSMFMFLTLRAKYSFANL